MTPNRKQWEQMWEDITAIERVLRKFAADDSVILKRVKNIKKLIQMVIGQME